MLPATAAAGAAGTGAEAQIVNTAHRVLVTATWNRAAGGDPPRAARRFAVECREQRPCARARAPRWPRASTRMHAFARSRATTPPTPVAPADPGEIYTGLGFDACSTPSPTTMAAWGASPYRAIGLYIGGANMACSQPNLSATWVSAGVRGRLAHDPHLRWPAVAVELVRLRRDRPGARPPPRAPRPPQDAVVDAQAIGMGAGNPIYFDMEAYNRTSTNTSAVLAFLAGMDHPAARQRVPVGRLLQRRVGDR